MTDPAARLAQLRWSLDAVDAELIELLGQRFRIIRDVAMHKRETGTPVMQPARMGEVFETRMQKAREAGLDPKLVERVWTAIISHACEIESEIVAVESASLPADLSVHTQLATQGSGRTD